MGYVDLTSLVQKMTDQQKNEFRKILVAMINVLEIDNNELLLAVDTAFNAHLMAVENKKADTVPKNSDTEGE